MTRETYEAMPYLDSAHPESFPSHLNLLAAKNAGLEVIAPSLVLEIGCGTGANLIEMAKAHPEAQFRGIDYSMKQINLACNAAFAQGVTNAQFRCVDILKLDAVEWGRALYSHIIAHGVYSWVDELVQDRILCCMNENLMPDGLGYISYNVLPGWSFKGVVREIMRYQSENLRSRGLEPNDEMNMRVQQGRAVMSLIGDASKGVTTFADRFYPLFIDSTNEVMAKYPDWYIAHDHLEDQNDPVWFHDFVDEIGRYNLKYVCDANDFTNGQRGIPDEPYKVICQRFSDPIRREQMFDFATCRAYRASIIRKA